MTPGAEVSSGGETEMHTEAFSVCSQGVGGGEGGARVVRGEGGGGEGCV